MGQLETIIGSVVVSGTAFAAYVLMMVAEHTKPQIPEDCTSMPATCGVPPGPTVGLGIAAIVCCFLAACFAQVAVRGPHTAYLSMSKAFVKHHRWGVSVWYCLAWCFTLVPVCYSSYLVWQQSTGSGAVPVGLFAGMGLIMLCSGVLWVGFVAMNFNADRLILAGVEDEDEDFTIVGGERGSGLPWVPSNF
ncbi:unnamed protein product [Closterium sp. NIES-65]|nr:unnamed protein product [Closterium sp. NIES-65]